MSRSSRGDRSRDRRSAAYTLLEMCLCLSVISTLLVTLGTALLTSHNAFVETMATTATEDMASRAVDRIIWELRFARRDTISLAKPIDSTSITYSKVQGWSSPVPLLSAVQTISLSSGRILLNGVPIADGVKTLSFNRNGKVISIMLEVERSAKLSGATRTISRHLETKITI